MELHPLESMTLSEAKKVQFRIVDIITKYFTGKEVLSLGDLGVVPGINKPTYTVKVEKVLKELFHAEAAVLLRGAGTGALREGIQSLLKPGGTMLVHEAPVYPTTMNTLDNMGIKLIQADFNNLKDLIRVLEENEMDAALIQYTRQKPDDSYSMDGGSQVQGHEAMEVLRGLIYAPVMIAIQNEVLLETQQRLASGEIQGIKGVYIANAQSKVLLVEFNDNIAKEILVEAEKLGAAQNPVGAESKYEFVPMFYRVSGTFRMFDPTIEERMIRINPMRSGADTIIRILRESMQNIERR